MNLSQAATHSLGVSLVEAAALSCQEFFAGEKNLRKRFADRSAAVSPHRSAGGSLADGCCVTELRGDHQCMHESELDLERPMPTPWQHYIDWLMPAWASLLSSSPAEKEVQVFLEAHPCLLPGALGDIGPGGNHGPELDGVYREAPLEGLGRRRRPDFMWVTRSTSLITPICIEIEKPDRRWFSANGRPTAELTQALDQISDWKVWFSEPENQLIFRETYVAGTRRDRALRPQYVLIYGRQGEFEVGGPHRQPGSLRKKRDFMRREDEVFLTFDSLRPKKDYSDFVTLSMTARGPMLHAVPPSFTTGPLTSRLATVIRNPRRAIEATPLWSDERKSYVLERWAYWKSVSEAPGGLRIHRMQTGE